MSSEPTHFLTLMNMLRHFWGESHVMQQPVLWPVSVSTRTSQGIGFRETLKNPANLFKNNLNNTRNDIKSQIKKKRMVRWNCGITNTNIFPKKSFSWGDKNLFGQKNYGEVVLNWRTNDQIMPRFGRNFIINDKCIFQ